MHDELHNMNSTIEFHCRRTSVQTLYNGLKMMHTRMKWLIQGHSARIAMTSVKEGSNRRIERE
jgi:hypothetical protein